MYYGKILFCYDGFHWLIQNAQTQMAVRHRTTPNKFLLCFHVNLQVSALNFTLSKRFPGKTH